MDDCDERWACGVFAGVRTCFHGPEAGGAAYLIYLGNNALLAALRRGAPANGPVAAIGTQRATAARSYRRGLLSNLGNPKIAVFFTSLLPQFVTAGDGSFLGLLFLALVCATMGLVWLTTYAVVVARAGDPLRRPRARQVLDGVTGVVFIALGLRLATAQR